MGQNVVYHELLLLCNPDLIDHLVLRYQGVDGGCSVQALPGVQVLLQNISALLRDC